MTKLQKIENLLIGLFMIGYAGLIIYLYRHFPQMSILAILVGITAVMAFNGARLLVYYFTMARHMVGGRSMLYRGILYIDLAAFILSLQFMPTSYMRIYLVFSLAFSGAVDLFGAFDSRRIGAHWRLKFIQGSITLFYSCYALLALRDESAVVSIFCLSLFSNALIRIFNSFRRDPVMTFQ